MGCDGDQVRGHRVHLHRGILHRRTILGVGIRSRVLARKVPFDEGGPEPELSEQHEVLVQRGHGARTSMQEEPKVGHGRSASSSSQGRS